MSCCFLFFALLDVDLHKHLSWLHQTFFSFFSSCSVCLCVSICVSVLLWDRQGVDLNPLHIIFIDKLAKVLHSNSYGHLQLSMCELQGEMHFSIQIQSKWCNTHTRGSQCNVCYAVFQHSQPAWETVFNISSVKDQRTSGAVSFLQGFELTCTLTTYLSELYQSVHSDQDHIGRCQILSIL